MCCPSHSRCTSRAGCRLHSRPRRNHPARVRTPRSRRRETRIGKCRLRTGSPPPPAALPWLDQRCHSVAPRADRGSVTPSRRRATGGALRAPAAGQSLRSARPIMPALSNGVGRSRPLQRQGPRPSDCPRSARHNAPALCLLACRARPRTAGPRRPSPRRGAGRGGDLRRPSDRRCPSEHRLDSEPSVHQRERRGRWTRSRTATSHLAVDFAPSSVGPLAHRYPYADGGGEEK